jgi:hypothetical protein
MLSRLALPTFILSTLLVAFADPTPTGPSPGQVFNEGSSCTITWTADPSGVWKTLDIELMTGDNANMVFLTSMISSILERALFDPLLSHTAVASVDGTVSPGTFSYPCPSVRLNYTCL